MYIIIIKNQGFLKIRLVCITVYITVKPSLFTNNQERNRPSSIQLIIIKPENEPTFIKQDKMIIITPIFNQ